MLPTDADLKTETRLAERYNVLRVRLFSQHADWAATVCPHCTGALTTEPRSRMTHWCESCQWFGGAPWFRRDMECQDCGDRFTGNTFDPEATTGHCRRCVDRFDTRVRQKYNFTKKDTPPSRPTESQVPF